MCDIKKYNNNSIIIENKIEDKIEDKLDILNKEYKKNLRWKEMQSIYFQQK